MLHHGIYSIQRYTYHMIYFLRWCTFLNYAPYDIIVFIDYYILLIEYHIVSNHLRRSHSSVVRIFLRCRLISKHQGRLLTSIWAWLLVILVSKDLVTCCECFAKIHKKPCHSWFSFDFLWCSSCFWNMLHVCQRNSFQAPSSCKIWAPPTSGNGKHRRPVHGYQLNYRSVNVPCQHNKDMGC